MSVKFRRLVRAHQDRLFSLAAHLLGNTAEAEDVVQDVLVKLWQHLAELAPGRVRPWCLRVTRNACLDLLRRRRYQAAFVSEAVNGGATRVEATPLDHAAGESLSQRLGAAIAELEEPFRSLIVLREIEECSYQEMGEVLELSDQQVRVYLHRARRKLRHRLRSELDD